MSLAASSESARLPSERVDALVAPIALYPDPLLAKVLIAATYPLEVDEAEHWLRQHSSLTGIALDHAIADQPWDSSIADLVRVPAVLSMLDERLEWTQNLGDTFLAQPRDVFASVQWLRGLGLSARTLHSTWQQRVTEGRNGTVIEPAVADVVHVPVYDPTVAFGEWPHSIYPPAWSTALRGFVHGPAIGFMAGIVVPAGFWKDTVDWTAGEVLIERTMRRGSRYRVTGRRWAHDPDHRRFVSYSSSQLRRRYGRDFTTGRETGENFRGYDRTYKPLVAERVARIRGSTVQTNVASNDTRSQARLSIFEDIGRGALERSFSRRGNTSLLAAHRDNSNFAIGTLAAAAIRTDVAAR